jgi:hypothetical protein
MQNSRMNLRAYTTALFAIQAMAVEFRHSAMAKLGTYESRGKGRGLVTYASTGTNAQAQRAAIKMRNRKRNKAHH